MTLTTHAIAGAAIATTMPSHPIIGFVLGFASHFVLDAIPHWDYKLSSTTGNEDALKRDMVIGGKGFFMDMFKIGSDVALGIILSFLLFGFALASNFHDTQMLIAILCGAIGGILPDPLQFVYWKFRHQPMIALQTFHQWIHTDLKLTGRPVLGVSTQMLLVAIIVSLRYLA